MDSVRKDVRLLAMAVLSLFLLWCIMGAKFESSLKATPRMSLAGSKGSTITFILNLTAEDACWDRTWVYPDGSRSARSFDCEGNESDTEVRKGTYGEGEYNVCVYLSASGDVKKKLCARFTVR